LGGVAVKAGVLVGEGAIVAATGSGVALVVAATARVSVASSGAVGVTVPVAGTVEQDASNIISAITIKGDL
jgi:glycerol-3-phosphate acyltransferase PlsY